MKRVPGFTEVSLVVLRTRPYAHMDFLHAENNLDSGPDEIDLHGLYVKEAIEQTEKGIISAQGRGDSEVRLIVGKVCCSRV